MPIRHGPVKFQFCSHLLLSDISMLFTSKNKSGHAHKCIPDSDGLQLAELKDL